MLPRRSAALVFVDGRWDWMNCLSRSSRSLSLIANNARGTGFDGWNGCSRSEGRKRVELAGTSTMDDRDGWGAGTRQRPSTRGRGDGHERTNERQHKAPALQRPRNLFLLGGNDWLTVVWWMNLAVQGNQDVHESCQHNRQGKALRVSLATHHVPGAGNLSLFQSHERERRRRRNQQRHTVTFS